MNPVVVVAALATLTVSAFAQTTDECSEALGSEWVWSKNFARKTSDCTLGYHCSNGQPVALARPCPGDLYFSLSLGVCVPPDTVYMTLFFGVNTCEQETQRYNQALRTRRVNTCTVFRQTYANGPSQTRLYAGDPQDCRQYFNCQVGGGKDWLHICPGGTYFDNIAGECSMLTLDRSRCAS
ncbi:uncharacterized protein LOC135472132 [Liolophura sinensis]|uniref:uncharacterized protein LOC135472132 n=1 Tax=Liolophura sinensis TaxID=3198878 RepID=UPI0031582570